MAYENVSFTKPTTGCYLEVYMLDSASTNRDVSAVKIRVRGLFQINCYAPLGTGMAVVEALADAVTDLYPVLPKVGTVSIEAPLSASSGIVDEAFMCIPVTGRYRAEF